LILVTVGGRSRQPCGGTPRRHASRAAWLCALVVLFSLPALPAAACGSLPADMHRRLVVEDLQRQQALAAALAAKAETIVIADVLSVAADGARVRVRQRIKGTGDAELQVAPANRLDALGCLPSADFGNVALWPGGCGTAGRSGEPARRARLPALGGLRQRRAVAGGTLPVLPGRRHRAACRQTAARAGGTHPGAGTGAGARTDGGAGNDGGAVMDLAIVLVVSALAIALHVVLYLVFRRWMDRDLALSLAGDDEDKRRYMLDCLRRAKAEGVRKRELQAWLEHEAARYGPPE